MKRLLLGGPCHGDIVECDEGWGWVTVRKPRDFQISDPRRGVSREEPTTWTAEYCCEDLILGNFVYLVARYQSVIVSNAFILHNAPRGSYDPRRPY
jgi:hypothetical protein